MTERTVSTALAQQDEASKVGDLIAQYQNDYERVLPQHVDAAHWVRLAQGLLRRDPNLADAARRNPGSLFSALLECARLGHDPGTDSFALVPFKSNAQDGPGIEVTGIEQYQGVIERMYRAGAVLTVVAEVVHKNDEFSWRPGQRPVHDADWFGKVADRGPLVGVYAYAEFKGGGISRVVVMGEDEVNRHKAVAKTQKIWNLWAEAMWRKTAVHELEKWVPTSAEYRREQMRALVEADNARQQAVHTTVTAVTPEADGVTGEVIEGVLEP